MDCMSEFTHFDESGASRMVDVGGKPITHRTAVACGRIQMNPATLKMIQTQSAKKGDVLEVARLAGIMGAKRTGDLIPLCHPIGLDSVTLEFEIEGDDTVVIMAETRVQARTGIEMEAMTAVSVAALTIYDMCKAVDRSMSILDVKLLKKSGGKSGDYIRDLE